MHFTSSFLLPTLLLLTPALVLARDCTHFETTYLIPCPNKHCDLKAPDTSPNGWAHAFQVNKEAFETWAKRDGIGGGCGGFCQKLQLTTPSGYTGATFTMRCVISRMRKVWDQGIPGYLEGLERIATNTNYDGVTLYDTGLFRERYLHVSKLGPSEIDSTKMLAVFALGLLLQLLVVSATATGERLGIHFENGNQDAPLLKLNYATYRATYNKTYDVSYPPILQESVCERVQKELINPPTYVFKNVRFAAPPLGPLRWAKPAPPLKMEAVQDGAEGRSCTQSSSRLVMGGVSTSPPGEDCLFLDVTVPGKAIKTPGATLPVVGKAFANNMFWGGADAMIKASGGNLVWVAGNYRLGAYGFLTGTTVEKEGVPNAGFWDQRAVLEWIQKYITLVGGDPKTVTAMGISAGAGSIVHHLILEGGKMDPLFTRAILQSPGYTNLMDRAGQLESNYKRFEDLAGCKGKGLACLRALNESSLQNASNSVNGGRRQGDFAFNPAPDGKFIMKTPTLEFAAGNYFKGIESIISSYVTNEGGMFADSTVTDDGKFDQLIVSTYGNSSETAWIKDQAAKLWPPISAPGSPYKTEQERLGSHVSEGSFTCHNRLIADAYPGKVWTVHYAVPPAGHGSDQTATFFNPASPQYATMTAAEKEGRAAFQSYLTSFARTGDPNKFRSEGQTIEWPKTTGVEGVTLRNTLQVDSLKGREGFRLVDDGLQVKERCEFWSRVQVAVEKRLGKGA
ncbi:hypothetical protein BLS_002475 [Venturia inaequalis]|uniref:Carboxylesterase type B domain-containing protein n=1 Tax=Venturia inaequalis TaxID=5025 RepID=A0A8H3U120_VENIN|nr:hypothetical protein BLS_002475 [Venturia inaequalis]